MALLLRALREWNGHSPTNSTYWMESEEQAAVLIKNGFAEPVYRKPQLMKNEHISITGRL